jgi:hypothetical protein
VLCQMVTLTFCLISTLGKVSFFIKHLFSHR